MVSKKLRKLLSVALLGVMAVMLIAMAVPALAITTTTVSIGSASVGVGQTATVSINIQTDAALGSATIRLDYNALVVAVTNVAAGDLGSVEFFTAPGSGRTTMVAAYASLPGKTGTVKFADVTLQAVGSAGATSPLTITVGDIANLDAVPIVPDTINSGTFTIPVQYTLNVTSSPVAGGSVGLSPAQPAGGYNTGTVVTLTATANGGYSFINWGGDLTGSTNPTTITMSSAKNVTANFTIIKYILTVNPAAGGSVGLSPAQPAGGYDTGTAVTLTATASAGYTFANWSGDLSGSTNPVTITMSSAKSVTANFTIVKYILTVNPAAGGSVGLSPAQPAGGYDTGTVVTLTATASAGYTFTSWSGDLSGSTNPTTITMISAKNVTANFTVKYTLTVTASPVAGGSVALNPVQPAGGYAEGTVVTLTATASTGYTFTNWGGDLTGSTTPNTITMNSAKNVTANFTVTYTLTVTASPAAGGNVGLSPAQPAGGYAAGIVVTLTATASAGYIFTNWGGDLSGSTNPTTITMSANRNVTANFMAPPTLSLPANGSTVGDLSPRLLWNPSTGATSYGLQVSTNSAFASITFDFTGITDTNRDLPDSILHWNTTYYWHVNATNASGTTGWSEFRSFTTPRQEGDVNNDGKIDSADALLVAKYIVGTGTLTGENFLAADVNDDNAVNSADLLFIKKYIVGTITQFPGQNSLDVILFNILYSPATVTVKSGTTVIWTNMDGVTHTVTSDTGGVFDSGSLAPNATFSHTFGSAGTFNYHCSIHFMTGTVIVQ